MSQLPDEIYVSEDSKYGTLDYVIAYTFFEDGNYDRKDMQEYIPTYRCEERIAEAKKTMIDKACEWLKRWTYQDCLGVSPITRLKVGFSSVEELVDAFKQAMED